MTAPAAADMPAMTLVPPSAFASFSSISSTRFERALMSSEADLEDSFSSLPMS